MIGLCEGCVGPATWQAAVVVYAMMAAPVVVPFILGWLTCAGWSKVRR